MERKTKAAKKGSCEKAGYNDTHNERAGEMTQEIKAKRKKKEKQFGLHSVKNSNDCN